MKWDERISSRPSYSELKAQHERWLSRQHLELSAATDDNFMRWTERRIAVLREMWLAGKQLKAIAYALGPTFTIGMVSAEVTRLGLPRRNGHRQ